MPSAAPCPQPLDVLPGRRVDDGAQRRRLARPQAPDMERVFVGFGAQIGVARRSHIEPAQLGAIRAVVTSHRVRSFRP